MKVSMGAMAVRWFLGVCRWLPLPVNHAFGALLGLVYVLFPSRDRHVAWVNLGLAFPELGRFQRTMRLLGFFMELGKTLTELGIIWLAPYDRIASLLVEQVHADWLEETNHGAQGVILLAPHMGAWEFIGTFLSKKMSMTNMYQPSNWADIDALIRSSRERTGAHLVPTDLTGVRALLKALKRNELVGVLPDQDPGENAGVFAPFFGHPANTMLLASKLSAKSHAMVLWVVCERLSWGRGYRLHYLPTGDAIRSQDELIAATALNAGVEVCVRQFPDQYVWNYKRWRRQPDNTKFY